MEEDDPFFFISFLNYDFSLFTFQISLRDFIFGNGVWFGWLQFCWTILISFDGNALNQSTKLRKCHRCKQQTWVASLYLFCPNVPNIYLWLFLVFFFVFFSLFYLLLILWLLINPNLVIPSMFKNWIDN